MSVNYVEIWLASIQLGLIWLVTSAIESESNLQTIYVNIFWFYNYEMCILN